jgi:hypothetical protein
MHSDTRAVLVIVWPSRMLTTAAPRIDERLVAALGRLDDPTLPIAEINRRLGVVSEALGLTRPSYQQVRVIVHQLRSQSRSPRVGETLLDISFRVKPPTAILDALAP